MEVLFLLKTKKQVNFNQKFLNTDCNGARRQYRTSPTTRFGSPPLRSVQRAVPLSADTSPAGAEWLPASQSPLGCQLALLRYAPALSAGASRCHVSLKRNRATLGDRFFCLVLAILSPEEDRFIAIHPHASIHIYTIYL